MFAWAGTLAHAQSAPAFTTHPPNPQANQPFMATFYYTWNPAALGFSWSHPVISGNTITLRFESGCGFLCPGNNNVYWPFEERMPALPAGTYTVDIVSLGRTIATFSLVVGASDPAAIPASGPLALLVAAASLVLATRRRLAGAKLRLNVSNHQRTPS